MRAPGRQGARAQALEEVGQPDEESVLVHTFGDRTYAWVDLPPADIRGFGLHAELLSQRVSDGENFERSVREILFLWQEAPDMIVFHPLAAS